MGRVVIDRRIKQAWLGYIFLWCRGAFRFDIGRGCGTGRNRRPGNSGGAGGISLFAGNLLAQRLRHRAARQRHVGMTDGGVNAGGHNGHAHLALHRRIQCGPHNDVGVGVHLFADLVGSFVQFKQRQIIAAGDVDQHPLGPFQADFVQQRVGDGFLGGQNGAVVAFGLARAHHRLAHFVHHRPDIGKIEVDDAGADHQVGHTLDPLIQHVIGQREGVGECRVFVGDAEQVLVGDDDQGIDDLLQGLDALFGLTHPFRTFKLERFGHHAHGQNAQFTRGLRNDRRSPGASAATHAGGDETHMRASQMIDDLFDRFFRSSRTNRCTGPCPQPFGDLDPHLDFRRGARLLQRLCVGVRHDELDPVQIFLDHVIDRISARATDAKYGNPGLEVFLPGQGEV